MRIFVTLMFSVLATFVCQWEQVAPHDVFGSCDVCMTTELALLDFTAADLKRPSKRTLDLIPLLIGLLLRI